MDRPATESASPQSVASEMPALQPRGRRGWWQFSLFSLLLLFVIACLIAGYVGQSRRMEEARREIARRDATIKQLRQELGIDEEVNSTLNVQDPTKLHVAALPSRDENAWRWKVYLPPGRKWQVKVEVLEPEAKGKPLWLVGGGGGGVHGDGELIMEARLERNLHGLPQVHIRIGQGGHAVGSSYLEPQAKPKGAIHINQTGRGTQLVAEPGKRVEVLKRTVMEQPQLVSGKRVSAELERSVLMIYLEENLPPTAAKKLRESFPK